MKNTKVWKFVSATMREHTAYSKYLFGHRARCVQSPYPLVSISVAFLLWFFFFTMFFRHESVLVFPPGLLRRWSVFCELFRRCRRKWKVLVKRIQMTCYLTVCGSCFVVMSGMTGSVTFGSRNFSVWSKNRTKFVFTWRSLAHSLRN